MLYMQPFLISQTAEFKFAYLFIACHYITPPSEKTRYESWPGSYMGKAFMTFMVLLLPPNVTFSKEGLSLNLLYFQDYE